MNSTHKVGVGMVPIVQSCRNMILTHVTMSAVRMLREELQLLQEPGSYVGEVIKVKAATDCANHID